jgi:cytochrome c biogenesis protein CcmG/thiol:disulfide interchange protein DsbE
VTQLQTPPVDVQPPPRRTATRRWIWTAVVAIIALAVLTVLGVGFGRDPRVVGSVLIDQPAPELAAATLDGGRFELADHRGEVVLVNVWASWCPPCVEEFPVLMDAARELGPVGLQVVGINSQDREQAARDFLDEMGAEGLFPHVADPDGQVAVDWGVFGLPETFVVDQDGIVRAKVIGLLTHDWVAQNVIPLLPEEP